jgi:hypothetical protein
MLRQSIFALFAACALSAAPGCDSLPEDATITLEDDEAGSGEDSSGAGEAEDEDAATPTHLLQCEQPIPCDAMPLSNPASASYDADAAVAYTETERCVLEALANGQPALVQTVADFDTSTAFLDFALAGDGIVQRQAHGDGAPIGSWANAPSGCLLRSPEFFDSCLKSFRASCLIPDYWVEDCEDLGGVVCPELAPND